MENLRYYQKLAVEKIYEFFISDKNKAKICISTGLGRTAIIVSTVETILSNKNNASIAILSSRRMACEQIESVLLQATEGIMIASYIHELKNQKMLITTYQDATKNQLDLGIFDLVICDEAQFLKSETYTVLLNKKFTKFLGVLQSAESSEGWFDDAVCLFSYTMRDALRDGYGSGINEKEFIQRFIIQLLDFRGFKNIFQETMICSVGNRNIRPDIVAEKDQNYLVMEVKYYRNLYISKVVIDSALKQILEYKQAISQDDKDKNFSYIIVMPCEIDDKLQREVFEQNNVVIWDINNLIYLCGDNKELSNLLTSSISYPIIELEAKKPLDMNSQIKNKVIPKLEESLLEDYQSKLEKCKPGKLDKADKEYEALCTQILKYLFKTEFFKISEQHKTDDEMFRMDLLCSLKGTTEFWKFLIAFYHTKFVVFEYKNYSDYIS